jgi:CRP/FNR family transcriptional regulator
MIAEERVAAFLLNVSRSYQLRGYASNDFILRMTRAEIGSYLGLTLETVSRVTTRFQSEGLLRAHNREIRLLDAERLRERTG